MSPFKIRNLARVPLHCLANIYSQLMDSDWLMIIHYLRDSKPKTHHQPTIIYELHRTNIKWIYGQDMVKSRYLNIRMLNDFEMYELVFETTSGKS